MLGIHGYELVHRCLPTLLCCIGNGVLSDGLAQFRVVTQEHHGIAKCVRLVGVVDEAVLAMA